MVNAIDCSFFLSNVKEFLEKTRYKSYLIAIDIMNISPSWATACALGKSTYIMNKKYKGKIIITCRLGLN